jgi:hypothetical protein
MKDYYPNMGLSELLCENFVVQFQNKVLTVQVCLVEAEGSAFGRPGPLARPLFSQGNPSCEKQDRGKYKNYGN